MAIRFVTSRPDATSGSRHETPSAARGRSAAALAMAGTLLSALALGANRPLGWTALTILIAALLAARALDDLRRPAPPALRSAALAPALLWIGVVAWILVQSAPDASGFIPQAWVHPAWNAVDVAEAVRSISADPYAGPTLAARLAAYAGLFWIAARAALDEGAAAALVGFAAVFSTGLAVFGIGAAATGVNPILGLDGAPTVVSASFVNRNSYATFAAFGMLANLAMTLRVARRGGSLREDLETFFGGSWVFALGAVICATALVATQSRAGVAAGVAGAIVLLVAWIRRGGARTGWIILALSATAFVAAVAGSGVARRLLGSDAEDARFIVFPLVLDGAGERLWLGHGFGAFQDVFRSFVPPEAAMGEWDKAHNSYLENLFELGLPATLAFYLALAMVTAQIWRGARRRRRSHAHVALALGVATTAALHAAFDFSMQMPATAALFAMLLGIGWAQSFPAAELKPDPGQVDRNAVAASSRTAVRTPE
jgi:O-antigen ligase